MSTVASSERNLGFGVPTLLNIEECLDKVLLGFHWCRYGSSLCGES